MKSVTHQTTLHLSFKIKCCVDRLRPPLKLGHCSTQSACLKSAITGSPFSLFDDVVGKREQCRRDLKTERLRGLEINHKLEPSRLFHRQIGGPGTLEDPAARRNRS